MKKIFVFILTFFVVNITFSQINVNQLFSQHPEVIIKFQIQDKTQLETLTRVVSIDKVTDNEVIAYANQKEFERFLTLNIPYEIVEKPVLTPEELNILNSDAFKNFRNDWNSYPNYQQYLELMQNFATADTICKLVEIGTSVNNRKLLACVISKNVGVREAEPQVFFTSSMHGDELTGYVLMLRYIDYLLKNYGSNERVTYLLDNMEIWINPLANPDGTFYTGDNNVSGAIRYNKNWVDLNRNYKDWKNGDHPDDEEWQKETLAFMGLQEAESFVLGVNLHGGAELCNYPWDNTYTLSADDAWWRFVCREYADTAHKYALPYDPYYMTDEVNGITNGAEWYVITGSRQDYANYYNHNREFTLEISGIKTPPASQLPNFWNYNYHSFLNYTQQALYGIHGVVTDACSGEPIRAKISIPNDVNNSFVMTDARVGYYVRPIKGGTYSVTYSAEGYTPQTVYITVSDKQKTVQNISLIPTTGDCDTPIANFEADKTKIFENETVIFSNLSEKATAWEWYFEGGTPETSIEQNPAVLYKNSGTFSVKLTAINDFGRHEKVKENYIVVVKKEDKVTEIEDIKMKIYPNPVSKEKFITIETDAVIQKIELVNLLGGIVKTTCPKDLPYNFSVSDIEKGIYFLTVETEKGGYTTKIIIQ